MDNPVPKFLSHFYTLMMLFFSEFDLSSLPEGILHHNLSMGPGVYAIYSRKNGKIYIGESAHVIGRLSTHWRFLNKRVHECAELQADWLTFGEENFVFSILCAGPEWADVKTRIAKENEIINSNRDKVYNVVDKTKINADKRCQPVEIEGIVYPTIAEASRVLGVSKAHIGRRIRSSQYPNPPLTFRILTLSEVSESEGGVWKKVDEQTAGERQVINSDKAPRWSGPFLFCNERPFGSLIAGKEKSSRPVE